MDVLLYQHNAKQPKIKLISWLEQIQCIKKVKHEKLCIPKSILK